MSGFDIRTRVRVRVRVRGRVRVGVRVSVRVRVRVDAIEWMLEQVRASEGDQPHLTRRTMPEEDDSTREATTRLFPPQDKSCMTASPRPVRRPRGSEQVQVWKDSFRVSTPPSSQTIRSRH